MLLIWITITIVYYILCFCCICSQICLIIIPHDYFKQLPSRILQSPPLLCILCWISITLPFFTVGSQFLISFASCCFFAWCECLRYNEICGLDSVQIIVHVSNHAGFYQLLLCEGKLKASSSHHSIKIFHKKNGGCIEVSKHGGHFASVLKWKRACMTKELGFC